MHTAKMSVEVASEASAGVIAALHHGTLKETTSLGEAQSGVDAARESLQKLRTKLANAALESSKLRGLLEAEAAAHSDLLATFREEQKKSDTRRASIKTVSSSPPAATKSPRCRTRLQRALMKQRKWNLVAVDNVASTCLASLPLFFFQGPRVLLRCSPACVFIYIPS